MKERISMALLKVPVQFSVLVLAFCFWSPGPHIFAVEEGFDSKLVCDKIAKTIQTLQEIELELETTYKPRVGYEDEIDNVLSKKPIGTTKETVALKGIKRLIELESESFAGIPKPPSVRAGASQWEKDNAKRLQEEYDSMVAQVKEMVSKNPNSATFEEKMRGRKSKAIQIRAYDGSRCVEFEPLKQMAVITKRQSHPISYYDCKYFSNLLLVVHPVDSTENSRESGGFRSIVEWLVDGKFTIGDEIIDSIECLKISQSSSDIQSSEMMRPTLVSTAWLSKQHNYLLLKHELSDKETGRPILRRRNTDLFEVAEGVWLPKHCELDEFGKSTSSNRDFSIPLRTTTILVKRVTTDVSDERFQIKIKPGSSVVDHLAPELYGIAYSPIRYRMPAKESDLRAVIESTSKRSSLSSRGIMSSVLLTIGGVVCVWFLIRSITRKASA